MKWMLLPLMAFIGAGSSPAQQASPSEPSPGLCTWYQEREPVPLNLDSLKNAVHHPGICAEGKVIVRILLDESGRYLKHVVLKTPHALWTTAVEEVLPMLRCTPAIMGGKPVKCWVTIPFLIR